jgi:TPR repeat protein
MWEEASQAGHLEALTDMGYLYENGLEDEETGRTILEPNFDKAYAYYSKAAAKNFPRALNNLATFYFSN